MQVPGITKSFQFYQVCRYASLVLVGVILANTGFSTLDIGVFETLILISGVTSFFWLNGLMNTFVVQSQQANYFPLKALLTNVSGITALVCILIIILQVAVRSFFVISTDTLTWVLVFIVLNNLSFVTEHLLLVREKAWSLIGLGMTHILLLPAFVLFVSLLTGQIQWVIAALCVFLVGKNIYLLLIARPVLKHASSMTASMLFMASLPLIGSYFFGGISIYADGVIVNYFFSKSEFAVYQYGAREFPVSLLLANAFSVVMIKFLSADPSAGFERTKLGSTKLWHPLFPIGMALMLASPYLFPVIFNPQFADSYIYFNIYLLLIIPRLIFPQSILISTGKTKVQLLISIIEFIINLVCSLWLMQYFGLAGIAFGTVIAYSFEKIAMVLYLNKQGIRLREYVDIRWFALYSIALIMVFILTTYPSL